MRQATLDRLRELGFPSYQAYLRSDLWASNKRSLNLAQHCWICKISSHLQVHHCSYENVGCEQPGDLIVLCQPHHHGLHRFVVGQGIALDRAHYAYRDWLDGLRQSERDRQRPCPAGVPEDLWYDHRARTRALSAPALDILRRVGPMNSQQIADCVCPGLDAGRMGNVMKALRRKRKVRKVKKDWILL
jgi:hypothetical protein